MTASHDKHRASRRAALLLAAGMVFLGGCAGGTLGNLIPLPKMLKGDVRNSVYYAKGDLFSIDSPFPQGSADYTYAEVKETYRDKQALVTFHTSTAGAEYYHADVERLPESSGDSVDLDTAADDAIARIQAMQKKGGRQPFVLVKQEPWNAKYTTGLIRLYTQKVPASDVAADSTRKYFTAYNLMYVTSESGKVAAVVADWVPGAPEAGPPQHVAVGGANHDPVKQAFSRNARAWKFINSINLDVKTADSQAGNGT